MVTKTIGIDTGDYRCTGSDDSTILQSACDFAKNNPGTTLQFLEGVFEFNTPVNFYSKTTFAGTRDAEGNYLSKLRLKDECGWPDNSQHLRYTTFFFGTGVSNVEFYNLEYDGNNANQSYVLRSPYTYTYPWGHGFHNFIVTSAVSYLRVHDCYMHDNLNDGLRCFVGDHIYFYDNVCYLLGHECAFQDSNGYSTPGSYFEAWGNNMTVKADGALRIDDGRYAKFHNNEITCLGNGNPGIQIGDHTGNVYDVEIYENVIENMPGPGIWVNDLATGINSNDKKVNIHNNIIRNCATRSDIAYGAGIYINGHNGTICKNNTIENCHNVGIRVSSPTASTNNYYISGNIITGTEKTRSDAWSGYGIANTTTPSVFCNSNILSDNETGDYYGSLIVGDDIAFACGGLGSSIPAITFVNDIDNSHISTSTRIISSLGGPELNSHEALTISLRVGTKGNIPSFVEDLNSKILCDTALKSHLSSPLFDGSAEPLGTQGIIFPLREGGYAYYPAKDIAAGASAFLVRGPNGDYSLLRMDQGAEVGGTIIMMNDKKGGIVGIATK